MANVLNKYNIYINSAFRDGGTPTNFRLKLQRPISKSKASSRFEVLVSDLEIPYSFYVLNSTNNYFTATLSDGITPITRTVVVSQGNYNITDLLTAINLAFNIAFSTNIGFTGSYNRNSYKVSFTFNYSAGYTLTFTFTTILQLMSGFTEPLIFGNGVSLIGNNSVNVHPVTSLHVRTTETSLIGGTSNSESVIGHNKSSNIICKIPVRVSSSQFIYYNSMNDNYKLLSHSSVIDQLQFYITDNISDTPIDTNGLPISLVLVIYEVEISESSMTLGTPQAQSNTKELENLRQDLIDNLENLKNKLV